MTYKINILKNANADLDWLRKNDKKTYCKCFDLVREIMEHPREGAVSLTPVSEHGNRGLRGKFRFGAETSTLELRLVPEIKVNWSALLNEN
jgi:mRNA-degrading endonuclease RelE of RelBE toxin-antitoxin system